MVIDFDKAPYKGQEMCVLAISSKEQPKARSLRYSLIMVANNQTVKKAFVEFKKEKIVGSTRKFVQRLILKLRILKCDNQSLTTPIPHPTKLEFIISKIRNHLHIGKTS